MSFLGLESYHVFVTGAQGGIGSEVVQEFLRQGCKVTAHDIRPIQLPATPSLFTVQGNISDESSVEACIATAREHHGPIHILIANAGITDESHSYPIWEIPLALWQKTYENNIQGTFLTIKHFLRSAQISQQQCGHELDNLAIVVTGSETGKFGQAGHTEYASGKAGLQYGLVRGVKNEIVRLNSKARINAVAPGWVDTPLIKGRLDDPGELWAEAQATVPLKKIAQPQDVARAMAFLASHRAAGHISGECISVDGGMEGRLLWRESEVAMDQGERAGVRMVESKTQTQTTQPEIPPAIPRSSKRRVQIALSVDFDAVSAWLGTGSHPDNTMADYSAGIFAGRVGVPRLVRLFQKLGIADKMTWFVPGHSMESFPAEMKQILDTGCEIGIHGYSHEGADQLTEDQERDVITKCIELTTKATGKRPVGYRAPLYRIRELTYALLEEQGFLYDSSLTHHDSQPFFVPRDPPIQPLDFGRPASHWTHPLARAGPTTSLVGIPCNWYMEDATPLQYYPHTPNSHGYVDVRNIEQMWKDRFMWLWENPTSENAGDFLFPIVLHPDTSGMPHVIGMIERFLRWLQGLGESVEFWRYEDIAKTWKEAQSGNAH